MFRPKRAPLIGAGLLLLAQFVRDLRRRFGKENLRYHEYCFTDRRPGDFRLFHTVTALPAPEPTCSFFLLDDA